MPKAVQDLGLILFVYAVGLQAGPRFFRTFRRMGLRFVAIGLSVALTGALATLGLTRLLGLPADLAAGLYTGALTCTPALAAAMAPSAVFRRNWAGRLPLGTALPILSV